MISRSIVLSGVLAILAAGAVALTFKLPKPAAAQQSIDPAIVTSHLRELAPDLALP
jgi:hypothetical protein